MSEIDAVDAMIERVAREEQEALDQAHGQHLLDMLDAKNNPQGVHPLLEAISQAHQAKAEADQQ